jgi:hypothetical protein
LGATVVAGFLALAFDAVFVVALAGALATVAFFKQALRDEALFSVWQ